jgi:hypothetical protein
MGRREFFQKLALYAIMTLSIKPMTISLRQFILSLFIVGLGNKLSAQQEGANTVFVPPAEWTVKQHKEQLKLTLIIDSIQQGNKVEKINFKRTLDIAFESDYLQVKGDIYIKIFIARNQEYGKRFYSWKWDYLRKKGDKYNKLDIGYYAPMDYNQPIPTNGNYGQGIGTEGESDYLMFYYRYKLE